MKGVAELAWRAAALYRKAGHPDNAAQVSENLQRAVLKKSYVGVNTRQGASWHHRNGGGASANFAPTEGANFSVGAKSV
jgi:hypothetical protein